MILRRGPPNWRENRSCRPIVDLRENGSALEVVLHDYALYKSTFTLLYYFTISAGFGIDHCWTVARVSSTFRRQLIGYNSYPSSISRDQQKPPRYASVNLVYVRQLRRYAEDNE